MAIYPSGFKGATMETKQELQEHILQLEDFLMYIKVYHNGEWQEFHREYDEKKRGE